MEDRFSENNPKDCINWLTHERHEKKTQNLKKISLEYRFHIKFY